jgi:predicted Zn-ribbon and HTH transcriptional regulator
MPCVCGRDVKPQHCHNCGRLDVYATRRLDRLIVVDGQKYVALGFRCRKCGFEFDESIKCDAPKRGLSLAAQRAGDAAANVLTGLPHDERMAKLTEMFGKRDKK